MEKTIQNAVFNDKIPFKMYHLQHEQKQNHKQTHYVSFAKTMNCCSKHKLFVIKMVYCCIQIFRTFTDITLVMPNCKYIA